MSTSFVEQWGRPLEKAGYTRIHDAFYRGEKWRRLVSVREKMLIECLISYQNDPRVKTMPSAKQLSYDSGVSYNQTRNLLKRLTNPVKDEDGKTTRRTLLVPVVMKNGRTRFNMLPLRYALEALEKPAVEIVKPPKVRPAPKPEPVILAEYQPDRDAVFQKAYVEPDEEAQADWEEIKECIKPEISPAAYESWVAGTRGERWDERTLVVAVYSSGHKDVMERWREIIKRVSRELFGNISVAFHVVLAATVGV